MAKNDKPATEAPALGAVSVAEHCRQYGISKTTFYELQRQGRGPRLMRIGGRTLVTHEAALAWQRAHGPPRERQERQRRDREANGQEGEERVQLERVLHLHEGHAPHRRDADERGERKRPRPAHARRRPRTLIRAILSRRAAARRRSGPPCTAG